MARSEPSYGPIARPRATRVGWRRQRAQRPQAMLVTRHVGSGSPQLSQTGGVIGTIRVQQAWQTGPRVGWSSGLRHAAHAGASSTASAASAQTQILRASVGLTHPEGDDWIKSSIHAVVKSFRLKAEDRAAG
ncbi:MAG: hypothetical protein ABI818_12935 [Acidobacteriota bacterium]